MTEFVFNDFSGFTATQTVNFWEKVMTTQSVPHVTYFDPESQDFSMDESCVELANFINSAHSLETLYLDNQVGDRPIWVDIAYASSADANDGTITISEYDDASSVVYTTSTSKTVNEKFNFSASLMRVDSPTTPKADRPGKKRFSRG